MPMFKKVFTFTAPIKQDTFVAQIKTGDFNSDGHLDFVASHIHQSLGTTPAELQIYLGDGKGGFSNQTHSMFPNGTPLVNYVPRMIVADFNNDGVSDIFAIDNGIDKAPFSGGQNKLFLSDGGKLLDATANLPQVMWNNHGASAGDIDNDGDLDVLVNALMHDGNKLLINNGTGVFQEAAHRMPELVEVAPWGPIVNQTHTWSGLIDVDQDGWLDMLLGTWDSPTSTDQSVVYLNDGQGRFGNSMPINLPISGVHLEITLDYKVIDLNGDDLPDLAVSITNGGTATEFYKTPYVQLLVNKGHGQFVDETAYRYPQSKDAHDHQASWYLSVEVVDLNRDGYDDMVLDNGTEGPAILMNDGTGRFNALESMFSGIESPQNAYHNFVAVGDVNGDGMPDLIKQSGYLSYSVYLNELDGPTGLGKIGKYDNSAVYRFFNQETGTHFYSGNKIEVENVLKNIPQFLLEGKAFAEIAGNPDTIDVLRLYNTETGSHFYTANAAEVESIVANLPQYQFEGVAYQAYADQGPDTTPLHRFFNTHTGTHFYTTNQSEMESVRVELVGTMNYEGVAYYVGL